MTFLEHLDELRRRLFRCAVVYVVALAICWYFSPRIVEFLLQPIKRHLFGGGDIVFIRLTEPFMVYMKASAVIALFVSSPFLLHQLWGFVAPGLYRHERAIGIAFLSFGSICFVAGGAFGYYVATPMAARWANITSGCCLPASKGHERPGPGRACSRWQAFAWGC